jgi:serine kinase of HPr protein (carbohydrate metabolism regulator)
LRRKSIRGLLEGSEARLGLREVFSLTDREFPASCCPECFLIAEPNDFPLVSPESILVLSDSAVKRLLIPEERERFLARLGKESVSCVAFADNQEPPEEFRRYCADHGIGLLLSCLGAPYLQSRVIGLLREKIRQTVLVHGVLTNVHGLGLLITGKAGVGKTTCGLDLAGKGHIWIADDLIEVVKKEGKLYGSGYKLARTFIAIRGEGILPTRSCPDITRMASDSPIQLWSELMTEPNMQTGAATRSLMGVPLPFSVFPSMSGHSRPATLIEKWVQGFTRPKDTL